MDRREIVQHPSVAVRGSLPSSLITAQEAIEAALDAYAIDGRGDVKSLKGNRMSRLRVGRYRVIFADDGETVLAIEITKRDTTTYKGPLLR